MRSLEHSITGRGLDDLPHGYLIKHVRTLKDGSGNGHNGLRHKHEGRETPIIALTVTSQIDIN